MASYLIINFIKSCFQRERSHLKTCFQQISLSALQTVLTPQSLMLIRERLKHMFHTVYNIFISVVLRLSCLTIIITHFHQNKIIISDSQHHFQFIFPPFNTHFWCGHLTTHFPLQTIYSSCPCRLDQKLKGASIKCPVLI